MMDEIISCVHNFIPSIVHSRHKGEMGRIGVLGGSMEYTGAPFFAGATALYCGADLVHILCAAMAAPAIKCYSPELIVHPILDNNLKDSLGLLPKIHAFVIGPGLGMSENVANTAEIMKACREANKPMVIDADGLYVVSQNKEILSGYKRAILTPNVNEFKLLYRTVFDCLPSDDPYETSKLALALGNLTIVRKGPTDIISDGNSLVTCDFEGSPRRCGGQGDLLSGAAAVFSHWMHTNNFQGPCSPAMAAGVVACVLTRRCAHLAFQKYRRSTVTMKMLNEIQGAFENLFPAI